MTPRKPPSYHGTCVESGHWVIAHRHVRAAFRGRSRNVLCWNVSPVDGDTEAPPIGGFLYLDDVRDWIRDQDERQQRETS